MSHYAQRRQAHSSAAAARPITLVVVPPNAWPSPGYYSLIIYLSTCRVCSVFISQHRARRKAMAIQ